MRQSGIRIGIAVLLAAAFLSACAEKGPILVDFSYQRPPQAGAEPTTVIVGAGPFKDDRGKSNSVVGRRYSSLNDEANDLVVQGTVSDKVAAALRNALRERDITFNDVSAWDLTDAGIPSDSAKVIIGGEIKNLWVEATSSFANTTAKAKVELRVMIADTETKKIIRTLNVSSATERQAITFSPEFIDETLSEALSIAINQIFNDEDLKSRLR
jgi:hypothetical protein